MKWKRILAMILAVASCLSLAVSASAANTVTRKATDFKDYDRTGHRAIRVDDGTGFAVKQSVIHGRRHGFGVPCGTVIVLEICCFAGSRACRRRGYCQ